MFLERTDRSSARISSRSLNADGVWTGVTWGEGRVAVEEIALGLLERGLRPSESVAIMARTRREWTWCDLAIQWAGGITVGIYLGLPDDRLRRDLAAVSARRIVVDDETTAARARSLGLEVLVIEGSGADGLAALREEGRRRRARRPEELRRRAEALQPETIASLVLTSGTSGEPKAVQLSHRSFCHVTWASSQVLPHAGKRALAFLPLAHAFQRYSSYLGLVAEVDAWYARSLDTVREDLETVRPQVTAMVPRILEKIHDEALRRGRAQTGLRGLLFRRGLSARLDAGSAGGIGSLAASLVGRRIRGALGGRIEFIGAGGAPLDPAVAAFFEAFGMPVLEGWGLSETCAPASLSTPSARRLGAVGRALPGMEITTAPDGELRVRGPSLFSGYLDAPAETAAAFDDEGWLLTGDLGTVDADGYVWITGRKKDLIVTAGGKKVAPAPLEHALTRHPWIEQAMVVGDRHPYLGALLSLRIEAKQLLSDRIGLDPERPDAEWLAHPEISEELGRHRAQLNAARPRFEQLGPLGALSCAPNAEDGTLTPTLKISRARLLEREADRVAHLYGVSGARGDSP